MKQKTCPDCGAILVKQTVKTDSYRTDNKTVSENYICEECGYKEKGKTYKR